MLTLPDPAPVLLFHAGWTFFLTGLVWFVQVVHYPLFAAVGRSEFPAYEAEHVRRVSWVVGPAMLAEAVSAGILVWVAEGPASRLVFAVNAVLLAAIWLSTALWQVPQHDRLRQGFRADAAARLIRTNWVRTVCWSLRSLLLAYAGFPAVVATMALAPSGSSPR
jgi:hypothetical protein